MKMLLSRGLLTLAVIAGSQAASPAIAAAQAPKPAAPSADSPTPRLPDGRPDLNGTWVPQSAAPAPKATKLPDGSVCVFGNCEPLTAVARAEGGEAPCGVCGESRAPFPKYKPEFLAKVKELNEKQVEFDTSLKCQAPGVPRIGAPDKIVQTAREVVFLYNDQNGPFFRIIPTDGRPLPKPTQWPTYFGDAVGKWEGDTLTVESANFNDETWLADNGAFHTKDLKVVERFSRTGNKLEYRVTSYDPAVLAEPWEGRVRTLQITNQEIDEPLRCEDRSTDHVVDGRHHDNPR